jgi:hypothetical protein
MRWPPRSFDPCTLLLRLSQCSIEHTLTYAQKVRVKTRIGAHRPFRVLSLHPLSLHPGE